MKIIKSLLALALSMVLSFGCFISCDEDGPKDRTENNSGGSYDDDDDYADDDEEWDDCYCDNGDCVICDGDGIYGGAECRRCDGTGICQNCHGKGGWYH